MAELWDLVRAIMPERVCSCLFCWYLLVDPLCFVRHCTFGHWGPFRHFVLARIDLLDAP